MGTSTWIDTTFSEISNLTSRKKMMRFFRTRPSDLRFLEDDHFVSFSIVRHPFERLVSAFYDFAHVKKRGEKYKKMTFEEFTRDLIKSAKKCWPIGQCLNPHFMPFVTACRYCENKYRGQIFTLKRYTNRVFF